MYLDFFGLTDRPFDATPDPRFLHLTSGHREALAQLLYGTRERRGFTVLTGEVGTGKTTLLHTLIERLGGEVAVAFVFNSALPFEGILDYVLEDFGVAKTGDSQARRLFALNHFLIERWRAGQNAVLILDEAQNLAPETLEQIRLLSNFETPTDKLLQIVLAGQPELRAKLQLPELRQLRQRIALHCNIPPLTPPETREYIHARLRTAGARDLGLFTEPAVRRIAQYARGVPRVVNTLCDHCLVIGYADQTRRIDVGTVGEAIAYLEHDGWRPRPAWRIPGKELAPHRRLGPGALATALVGGVAVLTLTSERLHPLLGLVATYLSDLWRSARHLVVK